MKFEIPTFKNKSAELFDYLKKNEKDLKKTLKEVKGWSDSMVSDIVLPETWKYDGSNVKALANLLGWCDQHNDVLIKGCSDKTISERGTQIRHLKDHQHNQDGVIGLTKGVYIEDTDYKGMNVDMIILESEVKEDYDKKAFMLYKENQIFQHSIGLQYVNIFLCMNTEEMTKYKSNYDTYFPQVINKEKIETMGYFWAVTEIKLIEVSAVLNGSNSQTPCIIRNFEKKDEIKQENKRIFV